MEKKLVCDIAPKAGNPRNSEGAFLRAPNGDILFAYSCYIGDSWHDHAACNIAMIRSSDEGETWSEEPVIIAEAAFFGTKNVMSVSACPLLDGTLAFYFLIKENDGSTTLGRTLSKDGILFTAERCEWKAPLAYYVVNNDRLERLADGRIVAPAASYSAYENGNGLRYSPAVTVLLVSEDDGASFYRLQDVVLAHNDRVNLGHGLQEPGIIELSPGISWMWMRTGASYQYESYSVNNLKSFTPPEASPFTSPDSPMEVIREDENTLYTVYNPVPNYNGKNCTGWGWGRTPLVIRKSTDNGKTFGAIRVIEDEDRGYCYPSMFFTKDGALLCSYCRGGEEDLACLCRLGIMKIDLASFDAE